MGPSSLLFIHSPLSHLCLEGKLSKILLQLCLYSLTVTTKQGWWSVPSNHTETTQDNYHTLFTYVTCCHSLSKVLDHFLTIRTLNPHFYPDCNNVPASPLLHFPGSQSLHLGWLPHIVSQWVHTPRGQWQQGINTEQKKSRLRTQEVSPPPQLFAPGAIVFD